MWKQMDYYALLGIALNQKLNKECIKSKYNKLVKILPKKVHSRLKKASDVLAHPVAKQTYDIQLKDNNHKHPKNFKFFSRT